MLASDGTTVVFPSLRSFRDHYQAYIQHGAILAASTPIEIGARRHLTLKIEDLTVTHRVHAVVQYRTGEALGFSIERFVDHKEPLRTIAEEIE